MEVWMVVAVVVFQLILLTLKQSISIHEKSSDKLTHGITGLGRDLRMSQRGMIPSSTPGRALLTQRRSQGCPHPQPVSLHGLLLPRAGLGMGPACISHSSQRPVLKILHWKHCSLSKWWLERRLPITHSLLATRRCHQHRAALGSWASLIPGLRNSCLSTLTQSSRQCPTSANITKSGTHKKRKSYFVLPLECMWQPPLRIKELRTKPDIWLGKINTFLPWLLFVYAVHS